MRVLGTKYGIEITKPWSPAMYAHNDMVADKMKTAIKEALDKALYHSKTTDVMEIAKSVCGYGFGDGYDVDAIHTDAVRNLEMVQNYWLDDWCWEELVEMGYVEDFEIKFVGYDKK